MLRLTPDGIHKYGGGYTEYVARTGHGPSEVARVTPLEVVRGQALSSAQGLTHAPDGVLERLQLCSPEPRGPVRFPGPRLHAQVRHREKVADVPLQDLDLVPGAWDAAVLHFVDVGDP
ncbi:hypothetical protein D7W79_03035 [Corallococcus exercitus]|nr:hypothetical protein D7W79_03035 [Corallococcus exercitus]